MNLKRQLIREMYIIIWTNASEHAQKMEPVSVCGGVLEYRITGLDVEIRNAPLAPSRSAECPEV